MFEVAERLRNVKVSASAAMNIATVDAEAGSGGSSTLEHQRSKMRQSDW